MLADDSFRQIFLNFFIRISGFFHHTSDDTFRTIGCQNTASGHAGIQSVEDFLIPHLRLLIGSERIKIDQVDPIRQNTRITVSLYFMQSKEIRNLDRNIPFRLMQGSFRPAQIISP